MKTIIRQSIHSTAEWLAKTPWELHVLLLLSLASALFAPVTVDAVRDIYQAYAIAEGEFFPLQGPQLAHTVHLGPLWFYLLALPAALWDTWAGIALFVFFLSAIKFYLAYHLGKSLYSSTLGLFFALMLTLPGWTGIQLIIWTHTNVLETALLLYLIALRKAMLNPGPAIWLCCGLCFSLALHAHPTALPFAALLLLAWASIRRPGYLFLWLLGAVLPFVPYITAQITQGLPDLAALGNYQVNEFSPGGPLDILRLIYSVVVVGPNLFYRTALPDAAVLPAITLHWLLIAYAVVGAALNYNKAAPALRKLLWAGLLGLLLITAAIVLMRGRTPWHLAYAPSFVLAFCYAVLLSIAAPAPLWRRGLLTPAVILLAVAVAAGTAQKLHNAELRFQELVLYDVKNLSSPWGPPGLEAPAWSAAAHGAFLCRQLPLVLHGPYAAMVDAHVGLEARLHCGQRGGILLGGQSHLDDSRHWAGISRPMQLALNTEPDERVGNVYLYRPLAVADSAQAIALAIGDVNPPRRPFSGGSGTVQQLELRSTEPSGLLISKPVGIYLSLDIQRVECNGRAAELLVDSNYAWLYGCAGQGDGEEYHWKAWYQASADNLTDAVLLPSCEFNQACSQVRKLPAD